MNDTRAVLRPVSPAEGAPETECVACHGRISWSAREKRWRVICNIYADGVWSHVEHWHEPCYREAGEPYGDAA